MIAGPRKYLVIAQKIYIAMIARQKGVLYALPKVPRVKLSQKRNSNGLAGIQMQKLRLQLHSIT